MNETEFDRFTAIKEKAFQDDWNNLVTAQEGGLLEPDKQEALNDQLFLIEMMEKLKNDVYSLELDKAHRGKTNSNPEPLQEFVQVFETENGKFAWFDESYGSHVPIQVVDKPSMATFWHSEKDINYYLADILKYQSNGLSHEENDGGSDFQYHAEHKIKGVRTIQLSVR